MTYSTQMKLLAVWLVLAVLASVVLMVVLLVRQPPEPAEFWRTVRRYFLLSLLVCTFLPVLLIVGRSAFAVYDAAGPTVVAYWWLPLVALVVAAVAAGGWLLWRWEHPKPVEPDDAAEPAPGQAQPVPMWSLPSAEQWDADSLPR